MHILLIHQYFLEKNEGGGSRFNEMTRIWAERGQEITVIAGMVHYAKGVKSPAYKGKFIVREMGGEKVTVFRCHASGAYNVNFIGRLWSYFSFVISSSICCMVMVHNKPDLVLATSPPLTVALTAMFVSFVKKAPLVFEVRDLWPESAIDTGVLTNKILITMAYGLEAAIYKKAALVNTLTPAFQKTLVEKKGLAASKLLMIPNAADFDIPDYLHRTFDKQAFRREYAISARFVATYVGAHGVANHLEQIIETAELVRDYDILFLLIGDGMQKPLLKELAATRHLSNVRFIDTVPKDIVYRFILASNAGISALKKCDTFKTIYSNKTFDYMACKRPVIMAIDGISRELVESAQCGLFVRPEDPLDFKDKLLFYFNNPKIAEKHGENGYNYAKQHFDRNILAVQYLESFNRILRLIK